MRQQRHDPQPGERTALDSPLHSLRAMAALARISGQVELQYRSNFWTYLLNSLFALGLSLLSLALVYRTIDELNGWSANDILLLVGVFFCLGGIVNGVVHSSVSQLVADIRTGDFDYRLLKPIDAQFVATVQRIDAWRAGDSLLGIVVIAFALQRAPQHATFANLGAALAMLALATLIVAGFWTLLSCITFWTIQGEGILWALDDMYDHLRWPITIFPPGLRLMLSTVFPAGFAVTVPAQALTGRLDAQTALAALALTVALLVLSRLAWRRGLGRYEGASA